VFVIRHLGRRQDCIESPSVVCRTNVSLDKSFLMSNQHATARHQGMTHPR
jgi:hypothetical protein